MSRYIGTIPAVEFRVDGQPLPKQSFRVLRNGGGYRDPRITAWQDRVSRAARDAMYGRELLTGTLSVDITFWRVNGARVDVDNLSKAVLDSCNQIVWQDDQQVVELHLRKFTDRQHPGIVVEVYRAVGE